ncbi:MAG: hypothetical protein V2G42_04505 [bacterium JZ-2024 1]
MKDSPKRESLEKFFPLEFCPYRSVSAGRLYCEISTDPLAKEIDDLVCFNCPVPNTLKQNDCIHLSLGTQVKFFKPGEGMVVDFACLAKNRRISLDDCVGCPIYHPRGTPADSATSGSASVLVTLEPEALADLEPTLSAPPIPLRQMNPLSELLPCDSLPDYNEKAVAVCGYPSQAFLTLYEVSYEPVLRTGFNLFPVLVKIDDLCDSGRLLAGARLAIFDISDLHPTVTLLLGVALGLKMPSLLFAHATRREALLECGLPFQAYRDAEDLRQLLRDALAKRLYEKKAG